jgi:hypothetical protein
MILSLAGGVIMKIVLVPFETFALTRHLYFDEDNLSGVTTAIILADPVET